MKTALQIGGVTAQPGSRASGFLRVANRADGSSINTPLILVNGKSDGPIVSVIAGVHGDEYESMLAASKFGWELNPQELKGAVIDVPIANMPAFDAGSRVSPIDHLNLNRVFPGREDGFITERIAFKITNEVIRGSQCFIDLHGGGNILGIGPLAEWCGEGAEGLKLAKAWGLELIWKSEPTRGLSTTAALDLGAHASLVEIGGESRFNHVTVEMFLSGLRNVMKYLGLIEGQPKFLERYLLGDGDFISCDSGGFYISEKKVHEIVAKGATIGRVYDVFGKEIEVVKAPIDGVILSIRTYPKVSPGDWVVCIGKASEV